MTGGIDPLEVLARLGLATALGAIIGFNRERLDWAAGQGCARTCWCAWGQRWR